MSRRRIVERGSALREAAVRKDGVISVRIIAPGWGSSGYWSEDVLRRDGARAFPKGTHMYVDHPTATEEVDRPERSLRDLAAVQVSDARWLEEGEHAEAPGLFGEYRVFPSWHAFVEEAAPSIGVSLRALGEGHVGVREGREGLVVDEIVEGLSVDLVTHAGAGGKVLQLAESARRLREIALAEDIDSVRAREEALQAAISKQATDLPDGAGLYVVDFGEDWVVFRIYNAEDLTGFWRSSYRVSDDDSVTVSSQRARVRQVIQWVPEDSGDPADDEEDEDMAEAVTQEQLAALQAQVDEQKATLETRDRELAEEKEARQRAEGALLTQEAAREVARLLGESDEGKALPEVTRTRLAESLSTSAPATDDGKLDREALAERVKKAVEEETTYLAEALGRTGKVGDLGSGDRGDGPENLDEASETRITEGLQRLGLSEAEAKAGARGR